MLEMFLSFGFSHHKAQDDLIMNLNICKFRGVGRGRFLFLMPISLRVKRILHLKGNTISYTIKNSHKIVPIFYDEYS